MSHRISTGCSSQGRRVPEKRLKHATIDRPHLILALELGGNNPLIAWDSPEDAASIIVHSAYVTSGQRCSCARRLIVPEGAQGDAIVGALEAMTARLRVSAWDEPGEAFMGPLASDAAAGGAHQAVARIEALGARTIRPFTGIPGRGDAFVTPALLDVTSIDVPDAEIFAPVLSVVRVPRFRRPRSAPPTPPALAFPLASSARMAISGRVLSRKAAPASSTAIGRQRARRRICRSGASASRATIGRVPTMPRIIVRIRSAASRRKKFSPCPFLTRQVTNNRK